MSHQSDLDEALIDATVMDDLAAMRRALSNGANVNARDAEHQGTPLMFASSEAAARLLLDHGADVDARNDRGATAFMLNCLVPRHRRGANIWRLLVERGAAVNVQNEDGDTALHWAVSSGDPALVKRFLALGAIPDTRDLKTAVAYGFIVIAELLEGALDTART